MKTLIKQDENSSIVLHESNGIKKYYRESIDGVKEINAYKIKRRDANDYMEIGPFFSIQDARDAIDQHNKRPSTNSYNKRLYSLIARI